MDTYKIEIICSAQRKINIWIQSFLKWLKKKTRMFNISLIFMLNHLCIFDTIYPFLLKLFGKKHTVCILFWLGYSTNAQCSLECVVNDKQLTLFYLKSSIISTLQMLPKAISKRYETLSTSGK